MAYKRLNQILLEGTVLKIQDDKSGYQIQTDYDEIWVAGNTEGLELGMDIRIVGVLKGGYVYAEHTDKVERS